MDPHKPNAWKVSTIESLPTATCVKAAFCPCIVYAENKSIINKTQGLTPDIFLYCCAIPFACCGATAAIGSSFRGEIRRDKNIAGSAFMDFFGHYFCAPCVLAQESKEVSL
jgi:Cys-rich protein (TIGR01571 family)